MDYDIPVYEGKHGKYILLSDMKEGYERLELQQFVFGRLQPLIQGKDGAVAGVFFSDYLEFLDYKAGKHVLIGS